MNKKINYVLAILIVVCFIVLIYRFSLPPPEEEFKPELPSEGIINIHEHIHWTSDADKWLDWIQ
jgi:hypothetical protein